MQMSSHKRLNVGRSAWLVAAALFASLAPALAFAQEAAPRLAAATTTVAAATAAATQDPPPAPTVTQTEPPPAAEDASSKPLSTAVWGRIGNYVQGADDPSKLNDLSQDAEVDVLLSGQIHKYVAWQADFVGTFGAGAENTGDASVLDLIGKLELHKTFNLWFGRMLVPSDRSNFSGPWFIAPWNYPGFYPSPDLGGAPVGPRQGDFGRNDGITAWGEFGGGVFKYYLGAFDLREKANSPLYTARLNLSLLNPEPGYYHSSTYYGLDILAIGVGAQYKEAGSVAPPPMVGAMALAPDDYSGFNVDVLFEKNLGSAGVFNVEGAYYVFNGDHEIVENHYFGLLSYLLPTKLGFGQIQPLVRYQGATPKAGGDQWRMIDAQVGYVISQYAARLALGYQNSKIGTTDSNQVFLGLQLQK
jgi:hypothetical protein